MSGWGPAFDSDARELVRRVVDGDRTAWSELIVRIAPHVEAWARASRLLRRCQLAGGDDVRAVMVAVLERLAANDHGNLRRFLARAEPELMPEDLVTVVMRLGRLDEPEDETPPRGERASGDSATDTPLRAWLLRLVDFAARDHVRDRYGWAAGDGPSKRDVNTGAASFDDAPEPAARPPFTDRVTMARLVAEIHEHIQTFPPAMRDALTLWLEDVDDADIAARLDLPDAARARALIRAGQARLRERFRGRSPLLFAS